MTKEQFEEAKSLVEYIENCKKQISAIEDGDHWLDRGADCLGAKITIQIRSGYDENRDVHIEVGDVCARHMRSYLKEYLEKEISESIKVFKQL